MSDSETKLKKSSRISKDSNAAKRQMRILKQHGAVLDITDDSVHRFEKKHAMNCGNPKCIMCSNPRKTFKELTPQEKRLFQDLDSIRDKHSNGLKNNEES